jgi:DnaJ-class molecular chaperone
MSEAHDRKQPSTRGARKGSSTSEYDGEEPLPEAEESQEPRVCMPCHGTGKVVSNLGGRSRKVTCPWCRGGGTRLTGMDAQEFQQEQVSLKRH